LRFKSQAGCRAAWPSVIRPGAAAANPRESSVPVRLRRPFLVMQIGVGAARQLRMVPVPAPFEGVAVHVVDAPWVWRVAAHLCSTSARRSRHRPVVWLAFEVRLLAAELVTKGSRRGRARAAGVFPLRFRWKSDLPTVRQLAGSAAERR